MKLFATAHHEAGHALADYRLGFKLLEVSIVADTKSAGRTKSRLGLKLKSLDYETPSARKLARCHEKIISMLAGREAQRLYSPHSIRTHMAQSDRESAVGILARLHPEPKEMRAVLKYLQIRTYNMIVDSRNWRMIEDLANALAEKRTLTGAETLNVFRQSFQNQLRQGRARIRRSRVPGKQ